MDEKNQIIILNGPPGSGKDAMAHWITKLSYEHLCFKDDMFKMAIALSGVTDLEWFERYNDRELKDAPWDAINGMSQRELMIHLSENVIKKVHGPGVFGKLLAERVCPDTDYVVSDGGFPEEIQALADAVRETHDVVVIRINRPGCTFDFDSRRYVYPSELEGVRGFEVINYEEHLPEVTLNLLRLVETGYCDKVCP